MKKMSWAAIAALVVVCAVAPGARAQSNTQGSQGPALQSRVAGRYFAPAYRFWGAFIASGNAATGSQTDVMCTPGTLPDGRTFNPFGNQNGTFAAILVDPQGSTSETVTPTAVTALAPSSNPASVPQTMQCYNVTASFSNVHLPSLSLDQVKSGDSGIQEALNDAAANGGGEVYWEADTGNVTLNTGGLTTTTTTKVPLTFTNLGGSVRVITTITGPATYSVGTVTSTAGFVNLCSSLTAGLDCSQFQVSPTKVSGGAGLTAILITATTTNPSAGVVHVKLWGTTEVQSNN